MCFLVNVLTLSKTVWINIFWSDQEMHGIVNRSVV